MNLYTYMGTIMLWPSQRVPKGWALCDGRALPRNDYPTLESLLGSNYGGDGDWSSGTFNLPDLRGRVLLGANPDSHAGSLGSLRPLSDGDHSAGQRCVALNYIIATEGFFPWYGEKEAWPFYGDPPYISSIVPYAGATPPAGWLKCEGQSLSIQDNAALCWLIGYYFGINPYELTFKLPDLRNAVPIGASEDLGLGETGVLGNSAGTALPLAGISYMIATRGTFPAFPD